MVCVCACVCCCCCCSHAMTYMWRSEDNFGNLFSPSTVRAGNTAQPLRPEQKEFAPLIHLISSHLRFHCLLSQEFVINISVCSLTLVLKMLDLENLGSLCNYVLSSENAQATNPDIGLMSETPVNSACG